MSDVLDIVSLSLVNLDSLISVCPEGNWSPSTSCDESDDDSDNDCESGMGNGVPRRTPAFIAAAPRNPPPISRKAARADVASVSSAVGAGGGRASAFLVGSGGGGLSSTSVLALRSNVNDAFEVEAALMDAARKVIVIAEETVMMMHTNSPVVKPMISSPSSPAPAPAPAPALAMELALTPAMVPADAHTPSTSEPMVVSPILTSAALMDSSPCPAPAPAPAPSLAPPALPAVLAGAPASPPPHAASARLPRTGTKRPHSAFKAPRLISPVSAEIVATALAAAALERATRSRTAREADEYFVTPAPKSDSDDEGMFTVAAVPAAAIVGTAPRLVPPPPQQLALVARWPTSALKPAKIVHSPTHQYCE